MQATSSDPELIVIKLRGTNQERRFDAPRVCSVLLKSILNKAGWGAGKLIKLKGAHEVNILNEDELGPGEYVFTAFQGEAHLFENIDLDAFLFSCFQIVQVQRVRLESKSSSTIAQQQCCNIQKSASDMQSGLSQ